MSRDTNQNLYAEEIINESPFYYDEHGRLRVRVLEEDVRLSYFKGGREIGARDEMPEKKPGGLQPPKVKDDEESKLRAEFDKEDEGSLYNARAYENPADHPRERKYQKWKEERKNKQQGGLTPVPEKKPELTPMPEKKPGAIPEIPNQKPPAIRPGTDQPVRGGIGQPRWYDGPTVRYRRWYDGPTVRGGVARPGLGKIIGGIRRPGIGGPKPPLPSDEKNIPPTQGSDKTSPGIERKPTFGNFRSRIRNLRDRMRGPSRNTNVRPVRPMAMAMAEDSRPATDYIEEKIDLKHPQWVK